MYSDDLSHAMHEPRSHKYMYERILAQVSPFCFTPSHTKRGYTINEFLPFHNETTIFHFVLLITVICVLIIQERERRKKE